jgi:epoxyqueuosine reductase
MTLPDGKATEKADILMHTCCGPCLEWPAQQLLSEGHRLLVYFYNPNIQPLAENQRRLANLLALTGKLGLTCLADLACEPETWLSWTDPDESRCRMCYRRRLTSAALKAKELGIPAFSTTLLVSPWQDHEAILSIGQAVAASTGVLFIGRDFREGYREGQRMAREDGLYRQRYCGCLPSLEQSDFRDKIKNELAALAETPEASDSDRR